MRLLTVLVAHHLRSIGLGGLVQMKGPQRGVHHPLDPYVTNIRCEAPLQWRHEPMTGSGRNLYYSLKQRVALSCHPVEQELLEGPAQDGDRPPSHTRRGEDLGDVVDAWSSVASWLKRSSTHLSDGYRDPMFQPSATGAPPPFAPQAASGFAEKPCAQPLSESPSTEQLGEERDRAVDEAAVRSSHPSLDTAPRESCPHYSVEAKPDTEELAAHSVQGHRPPWTNETIRVMPQRMMMDGYRSEALTHSDRSSAPDGAASAYRSPVRYAVRSWHRVSRSARRHEAPLQGGDRPQPHPPTSSESEKQPAATHRVGCRHGSLERAPARRRIAACVHAPARYLVDRTAVE